MKRILLGLASLAVAATAACGNTPAASPSSRASAQGGTLVSPVNPVPEATGPSVRMSIDGVDQPTAFCQQFVSKGSSSCTDTYGMDGRPPTTVFCGDAWGNGPPGPRLDETPLYAITWGYPPTIAGYNGPSDPGNVSIAGLSDAGSELSMIRFFKSDLSKPIEIMLNPPPELRPRDGNWYHGVDANGNPGDGLPLVQTTRVGQTWHITGQVKGGGFPDDPIKPFEVTVTCP
jgi:hypothetical protein